MLGSSLDAEIQKKRKQLQLLLLAKDNPAVYELMKKVDLFESKIQHQKEPSKTQGREVYYGEVKSSDWTNYSGCIDQKQVKIDYSHLKLKNNPLIFTNLAGDSKHWRFNGINSIYHQSSTDCILVLQHQGNMPKIQIQSLLSNSPSRRVIAQHDHLSIS